MLATASSKVSFSLHSLMVKHLLTLLEKNKTRQNRFNNDGLDRQYKIMPSGKLLFSHNCTYSTAGQSKNSLSILTHLL